MPFDIGSSLIQVMAWCHHATSILLTHQPLVVPAVMVRWNLVNIDSPWSNCTGNSRKHWLQLFLNLNSYFILRNDHSEHIYSGPNVWMYFCDAFLSNDTASSREFGSVPNHHWNQCQLLSIQPSRIIFRATTMKSQTLLIEKITSKIPSAKYSQFHLGANLLPVTHLYWEVLNQILW